MKKLNYLLGALALAGFVACSSNEEVASVEGLQQKALTSQSIGFSPLTKGSTRSTVINSISDISSFKVRGTWNSQAPTLLSNSAISNKVWIEGLPKTVGETSGGADVQTPVAGNVYGGFGTGVEIVNSSGWNYKNSSDMQYWPYYAKAVTGSGTDQKVTAYACLPLDFNAVAPANAGIDLTKADFAYTGVPVANMVDICYATATNQTSSPVEMKFNHIFSQLIVKVKKADGYTVDIKEVAIGGVKPNGTLTLSGVKDASGKAQWGTALGTATSYDLFNSATPYSVPNSAASESASQMTPSGQELLLVPQTITKWNPTATGENSSATASGNGYIAITYRAKKSDADTWATNTVEGSDGYTTTYFPLAAKWYMGKLYAYTLLFGGVADPDKPTTPDPGNPDPGSGEGENPGGYTEDGGVKAPSVPITFTASVSDWETQTVDVDF